MSRVMRGWVPGTVLLVAASAAWAQGGPPGGGGPPAGGGGGLASQPPTISKSFAPAITGIGVVSRLTFTITNPNPSAPAKLYNLEFQDTYPAGLVNANPPNLTNTCGGDNVAGSDIFGGVAGGNTIGLQGPWNDLTWGGTCQVGVDVVSAAPGTYDNVSGAVSGCTTNGCTTRLTGNTASASVQVAGPSIAKSFNPSAKGAIGDSVMTLTLTNITGGAMTATTFTDTFPVTPGAMTLANPSAVNGCGGTLSDAGGGSLGAGDTGIRLSGGTIPSAGSCTITVNVTASAVGTYTNTIDAAAVTSSGGWNEAAATADLVVVPPIGVTKVSTVISDPYNGTGAPKRVPGAVIEYTLLLSNAGSPITADNVIVADLLPAGVTFVPGSLVVDGVAEDDDAAGADETDPDGADHAAGTVTMRIASIPAGGAKSAVFRVAVD